MAVTPEPDAEVWIAAAILFAAALGGLCWYLAGANRKREFMDQIARFASKHSWLETTLDMPASASPHDRLERISAALDVWYRRFRSIQPAEPLLPFLAGAGPDVPATVVSGLFQAARKQFAAAHSGAAEAVRTYVRADIIDAYLALWVSILDHEGFAGVSSHRDRLGGIDEPGFDALLGADLALATYIEDDESLVALAGAIAVAATLVRDNLFRAGVVVDRPRLLCAADLASIGFRAVLEPGDSTRTSWIDAAQDVIESEAFNQVDKKTIVVAVDQFGFKRDGRLVRTTRLCGYNPPEWRRA